MKKKNTIISLLLALVMLVTVFSVNVSEADAAVNKNTYWIKVNTQCNVVTVYKKSGSTYKPIRAMVCSCGKKGHSTPQGTFRMGTKIGWCKLVGNVWGQYSMVIKGNYLFHSVPLKKKSKSTMKYKEYNKLGTNCSHGCVRLSTMDAKWIWDHCPKKTKITVYRSSDPGPLGKPTPIKMKKSWKYDPTDPTKKNKNFKMKKPAIYISSSKAKTVEQGSSYSLKSGVTAKNLNAYQSLTSKVKVYKVYKYSSSKKKYVKVKSFSTKKTGKYKIRYKVYDYYCGGSSYKNFYVTVKKPEKITITAANRELEIGSENAINAVEGVVAKQATTNRTKYLTVSILEPGETVPVNLSYADAQNFIFDKAGEYKITYTLKNTISPFKTVSKTITVVCNEPEIIEPIEPIDPTEP
ncbi:MAG: L,D-transpeptidase, partial [Bacillota bacterium]|nr:L,D-transpeptidase [Bacillota bacterium]